jgi:hypothetical protein
MKPTDIALEETWGELEEESSKRFEFDEQTSVSH